MTLIAFVRHGTTTWNKEKRNAGQIDIELADEGRLQSVYIGKHLMKENWAHIYSSDLSRAKETAQIISAYVNIPSIKLDQRLRARHRGSGEGTTEEERIKKWGHKWGPDNDDYESDCSLMKRAAESFEEIVKKHNGSNIIIVTHGGIISKLLSSLGLTDSPLKNGSITIIKKETENWKLLMHNCRTHLSESQLLLNFSK